jgi:hypothetical protein
MWVGFVWFRIGTGGELMWTLLHHVATTTTISSSATSTTSISTTQSSTQIAFRLLTFSTR